VPVGVTSGFSSVVGISATGAGISPVVVGSGVTVGVGAGISVGGTVVVSVVDVVGVPPITGVIGSTFVGSVGFIN
jgi:hypothetical protein